MGLFSGPFRDANADATVNGSANRAQFAHLFEQLYKWASRPAPCVAVTDSRTHERHGHTHQLHRRHTSRLIHTPFTAAPQACLSGGEAALIHTARPAQSQPSPTPHARDSPRLHARFTPHAWPSFTPRARRYAAKSLGESLRRDGPLELAGAGAEEEDGAAQLKGGRLRSLIGQVQTSRPLPS